MRRSAQGETPGLPEPLPQRAVNRIVNKADFERLLAARSRSRSAHFALHHVDGGPAPRQRPGAKLGRDELSTSTAPVCPEPVDDLPPGLWLGCVVPKRHARRAVTRTLLKRQVRSAFERHAASLPGGLWLVRLRHPFAPAEFISARSVALAAAARSELDGLLLQART